MVQYEKLIEKLFPSYFVIEEVIRQKYAWVLYRAWKRMKTNYFEKVIIIYIYLLIKKQ